MLNEIQIIPGQNNCVIVSTGYPQGNNLKAMEKRTIPIAPAPVKVTNYQQTNITSDLLRCRKKMNYKPGTYSSHQSASIIRRNARERNRVKQVNDGFAALRRHLPPTVVAALSNNAGRGASKKLSKVDTLRMVVEYIRYLQQLLDESDESLESCNRSENQENNMYYTQSSMPLDISQRLDHGYLLDQTPPSSEASTSPAPSFSSEVSGSGYPMTSCFPLEKYESHHHTINPMDEELLDVISWWQQK